MQLKKVNDRDFYLFRVLGMKSRLHNIFIIDFIAKYVIEYRACWTVERHVLPEHFYFLDIIEDIDQRKRSGAFDSSWSIKHYLLT